MKTSAFALGGLLFTATSTLALAQVQTPPPGGPASIEAPVENPFNVANIDQSKPFGEINVEIATNPDALAAWEQTLSEAQITELDQRCDVISTAPEFAAEPRAFCDMWAIVRAGEMGNPAAAAVTEQGPGPGVTQTPAPAAPAP